MQGGDGGCRESEDNGKGVQQLCTTATSLTLGRG